MSPPEFDGPSIGGHADPPMPRVDDDPSRVAAIRPMVESGDYASVAWAHGDVVLRLDGQPRGLTVARTADG
jgi:hypothetical protein